MVIKNGNVGIGTTSPRYRLCIGDGGYGIYEANNAFNIYQGTSSARELRLMSTGSVRVNIDANNNDNNTKAFIVAKDSISNGGSELFRIGENGNVGIGTTSPSAKLQVNGTVRAKGFIFQDSVSSHLSYDGAMYRYGGRCYLAYDDHFYFRRTRDGKTYDVGGWAMSDLKLKKNICKETNILNRLANLEVKNFQWKRGNDSEKDIGFIAQDVEPLFPDLVGSMIDPDTGEINLTLKYTSFGVLAVGAIKELKDEKDAEIDSLKGENKRLAELLNKQQQQFADLSAKVEQLLRK